MYPSFILLGLLALGACAEISTVHVIVKRAVTYAQTCTYYSTVTAAGAQLTTSFFSSTCNSPLVSGPFVTQDCFTGLALGISSCSAAVTASACAPSTTTRTSTTFFLNLGVLIPIGTGTTTITTSTCSATAFPPNPLQPAAGTVCLADNIGGVRSLSGPSTSSNSMTNAACKTYCTSLGFAYSGTEYSSECYCGNTLPTVSSSSCNMGCSASGSTEICGGPNALSVSTNSALVTSNIAAASWFAQGCYSDNYPSRVLASTSTTSSTLTIEKCITFCNGAGYTLAGLENGYECYCASTIQSDGSTYGVGGQAGCTFTCSGNSTQLCGGNNVLNLYSKNSGAPTVAAAAAPVPATANGYTYVNCYADQTSAGRTLTVNKSTITSVEACVTACNTAGFKYAGVENRNECWCDNVIHTSTTLAPKNCLLPCTGTPSESCGGINAIGIYQGTASTNVRIPGTAGGYTYLDSFVDPTSARLLPMQQNLASNTVGNCARACSNGGYSYAGVEYGSQCFCGSSLPGSPTGGQTPNIQCTGNSSQFCGGNNILQVYSGTPAPTVLTPPVTNGQCVADNTNNVRTLSTSGGSSSSMTPAACKTACVGFVYYGVEYGSECWCGNSFPSSTVVSTQCTMQCSGDAAQTCGGSWALNMYNS
ncbi:hypothetical protein ONS95_001851 [Cadophora gregata]|uniref:uncharacterized protein n=1 Tax=Cadophora gregata TaxID=51156 RepID=UPI0026DB1898|nr:uncharacterized protein ONS95_001851 [Cadophora gregata]KAK0111496.1 hypothetical protein ONS95_001851 [Cadophora gregata]KAK0112028.1 hypothetical protein ONS96_001289 [Cadophora gregata f. sp. sojae]